MIFLGKIPFLFFLKKILIFIPLFIFGSIFFLKDEFKNFGEMGLGLLVVILILRPLSQILPEFKIIQKIVTLRKELGIICASLILSHAIGYFLSHESLLATIQDPYFWELDNSLMWGFCGLIITFLLLITSNFLAIKILGKWWKSIQRLSYLLLILSSSHVLLLEREVKLWEFIDSFFPVFLVFICWVLARKGVRLKIFPGKL